MVSTMANNALFFGAALAILLVVSFALSRLIGRVVGLGLRATGVTDREALQRMLAKRASRIILLLTTVLSLALISAAVLLSVYGIDVTPSVREWFATTILLDPRAMGWVAGQVLLIVLAAAAVRGVLSLIVGLVIERMLVNPAFIRNREQLERLRQRVMTLLRWGIRFGALLAAALLFDAPAGVTEPLEAATYIVVGVLVARALVAVVDVGIDIVVQLIRTLESRRAPMRYFGRLEHLASITKRTLEYVCFVGAGTFVVHQLRPGTWLAEMGVIAIRLIALVYVGRVVIEVFGLLLREVLLTGQESRKEAEQQQRMTLVPVASSILRYAVYFSITVMGLQEIGVDTSPILAGAGLLGLAVGLGAQTLVGDLVSGFFILFEGLFLVGDRIRVGEVVGNVEEIGIRVLKIRDEYGILHCIPNGEVRAVANHARQYVNAVVEFSLPYEENIPGILDHLRDQLAQKRSMHPDILSDTDFSIQGLKDTGALIRSLTRVKPSKDDAVGDVIRVALFEELTALGVMPSACYVIKMHQSARPRPDLFEPAGVQAAKE
jgi:small conductance mechanosensitive channel